MLMRQNRAVIRAAFTLMEIMVVVAIILILASAGVIVTTSMLANAKIDRAKMDCKSLETAVTSYMTRHTQYPDTLEQLTRAQDDGSAALLTQKALLDPWGQYYQYDRSMLHPQTRKPKIWSQGSPDAGMEISNWGTDTVTGQ